jgi:hypothetical protein
VPFFVCAQRIAGWQEGQVLPSQFWDHHFIVHRRFQHVLKDLDYTLQTTGKPSPSAIGGQSHVLCHRYIHGA